MVTPFQNGSIDFTAYTRLIELQIANRTDAIVCCATTGESSTLTTDERLSIIQFVVERVNGRVPVIASTGGNNTEEVIENSKSAEAIGVDGLLVVTPYYNKTTQQGLLRHYFTVADSVDTPMIVYNKFLAKTSNWPDNGRKSKRSYVIRASQGSGAGYARPAWTNCRNASTCCGAR